MSNYNFGHKTTPKTWLGSVLEKEWRKDNPDLDPNDPLIKAMLDYRVFRSNPPQFDTEGNRVEVYNSKSNDNYQPGKMLDFPQGIRKAGWDAKSRQANNQNKAIQQAYELAGYLDRKLSPEGFAIKMGYGKGSMPVGGRAGMVNLNRPQYVAAMNAAEAGLPEAIKQYDENESANSLQAERNKAKGFLGINKRDDGSVYYTGSELRRQTLESEIDDLDKEIAKVRAEISMSEAGDPMYKLAVMRMIMNDDNTLMSDIRGRIGKKIDQEFQEKTRKATQDFQHEENELNRENTLEVAKMNREDNKQDKKDAARRSANRHRAWIHTLNDKYTSEPSLGNRLEIVREWLDLQDAADEAGYENIEEFVGKEDYKLIMEALGMEPPKDSSEGSSESSESPYSNKQEWQNAWDRTLRQIRSKNNEDYQALKDLLAKSGKHLSKEEKSKLKGEIQKLEDDWKAGAITRKVSEIQKKANAILADLRNGDIDRLSAMDKLDKLREKGVIDVSYSNLADANKASVTVKYIKKGKK